jgi:murein DD-endopeptidase MepM/ murein hydrolase activator NlpD
LIQLLADENIPKETVNFLKRQGFDIISVIEKQNKIANAESTLNSQSSMYIEGNCSFLKSANHQAFLALQRLFRKPKPSPISTSGYDARAKPESKQGFFGLT